MGLEELLLCPPMGLDYPFSDRKQSDCLGNTVANLHTLELLHKGF